MPSRGMPRVTRARSEPVDRQQAGSPRCGPCDGIVDGLLVPAQAFWMVCLTVFIDSLGGSISAPVLPFYAKEFHCSSFDVGLLFSSFSAAQVVFLPVLGKLSDYFGRRKVLVGSLFGAALGAWGQGMAGSYSMFLIARTFSGAFGAVGSTANVYVSDITSERYRGMYLGYLMNSNGAAFAFGPGLGGGLSRFGLNVPILVNGAMCLISGVLSFMYLPESPVYLRQQREEARLQELPDSSSERKAMLNFPPALWVVFAVEFLRGFSFSAIFALYGLFALAVYGMDSLHIGYTVCIGALTLISSNVWLNGPTQRVFGEVGSAALGVAVMAVGEVVLAYAPFLSLSLLGVWSVYMGQAIAGSNIAAVTSMLATDDNRGEVMSMQQTAQALGRVLGPVLLGRLAEKDQRLPFAIAAAALLVSAVLLWGIRSSFLRFVEFPDAEVPLKPSPKSIPEEFSQEDADELGTFLCELLTQGGYRWHEPKQRAALKEALTLYFPPLAEEADVEKKPGRRRNMSSVTSFGAEVNITGDDSNFLRSPQIGRRSYSSSMARRSTKE